MTYFDSTGQSLVICDTRSFVLKLFNSEIDSLGTPKQIFNKK